MNASFHVLEEILQGFDRGVEGQLIEKFSKRYGKDFGLKKINQTYQTYLSDKTPEKRILLRKRVEELAAARKFESSGAREIALKDRRRFDTKTFYKHEEE